jgi:LmbE family N-acetylglucosaminyl deacetylase
MAHFPVRVLLGLPIAPLCLTLGVDLRAQESSGSARVLPIGAHPDDVEVKAGGTAALLAGRGHAVKFVSFTNGDAGHHEMGGGVLAKRRRAEAKEAAQRLGIGAHEVLHYHDGDLMPTLEVRRDVIRLIRERHADAVVGHRPSDYHPDHRYAGRVVQDALDEVPETEAAPKDRLRERWTSPMSDAARKGQGQWYGDGVVQEAQYAESFQIAECGRQPTEAEIRRLLPVLAGE